jgi:uncharacterized protein (TIGR02466 family)
MILDNFFPSTIGREEHFEWADNLLPKVKDYFENQPSNPDFYANGRTTHNMNLDLTKHPDYAPFCDFIQTKGREYLEVQGYDSAPVKFNPYFFLNYFKEGSAHPKHVHSQCTISGIFYLQTPPGSSNIRFLPNQPFRDFFDYMFHIKDPDNWYALKHYDYKPYPGLLLMWPAWLYHEVLPNQSTDPRISIVFNL